MVNWGNDQNDKLIRCIKRGDIDSHNTDGDYLFGKTVQLSKALKGTGDKNQGQNLLCAFAKSSGTTALTGLCPGGKNELQQVSYLPHIHYFYRLSPFPFQSSPLASVSALDISGEDNNINDNSYYGLSEEDTEMQDKGASSVAKKASIVKKPPASKSDPTAAITSGLRHCLYAGWKNFGLFRPYIRPTAIKNSEVGSCCRPCAFRKKCRS